MFYKVLFLLTLFNLFKSCKSFVKENVIFDGGEMTAISPGKYISFGLTVLYHVLVLSVCLIPSIIF